MSDRHEFFSRHEVGEPDRIFGLTRSRAHRGVVDGHGATLGAATECAPSGVEGTTSPQQVTPCTAAVEARKEAPAYRPASGRSRCPSI